jgi:hypothetical protein
MKARLPPEVWAEVGKLLPNNSLRTLCSVLQIPSLQAAFDSRWKCYLAHHLPRTRCIGQRYPIQSTVCRCVVAHCPGTRAYMLDLTLETFVLLREGPYCWAHRPREWGLVN